jgi:DNA invertase Pin-like site-specific DNA recombinase
VAAIGDTLIVRKFDRLVRSMKHVPVEILSRQAWLMR